MSKIKKDIQDRNSEAWIKLCEYIENLSNSKEEEFDPRQVLGNELFAQIYTLPNSISKLKNVKKMMLYGSNLRIIPPAIGEMQELEEFVPYCSYDLLWFPYEITNCKNLKSSTISTRALYGNHKNRKPFPNLVDKPVRYEGVEIKCSVCKKELTYENTTQFWITLRVATDIIPLLTNLCSIECKDKLPTPPEYYIQYPHLGGEELKQPNMSELDYYKALGQLKQITKEDEELLDWFRSKE